MIVNICPKFWKLRSQNHGNGKGSIKLIGKKGEFIKIDNNIGLSIEKHVNYNLGVDNGLSILGLDAIGYSVSGDIEFTAVMGAAASTGVQRLVFTNGPYAWYPYTYTYGEASPTFGWNPGSISGSMQVIAAGYVGNFQGSYRPEPKDYASTYDIILGFTADLSLELSVGAVFQINYWDTSDPHPEENEKWMSMSMGLSVGAQILPGASFSIKTTTPRILYDSGIPNATATCNLISSIPKPTNERSIWDKSLAWLRFFDMQPSHILLNALGEVVLNLIKKESS